MITATWAGSLSGSRPKTWRGSDFKNFLFFFGKDFIQPLDILVGHFLNLFLALISMQVLALDFQFEVPVKLNQIPRGIPQAKIECDVYAKIDKNQLIASGYSIRGIDSGRGQLNENFSVVASYLPDWRDSAAGSYQCRLLLLTPWAKPSWQAPSAEHSLPELVPAEQAEAITIVSGAIN